MSPVPGNCSSSHLAPLVKQLVGKVVHVALADGVAVVGQLVSFDGRSLWMLAGGEDIFIPLQAVATVLAAPVAVQAHVLT